jgi:transcriptional regulator with XRE-family HTH domain
MSSTESDREHDPGIAERLKQVRGSQTQKQFATALGLSISSVARYEQTGRTPNAFALLQLKRSGVDLDWLLFGAERGDARLSPKEAALLDNYRNTDVTGQRAMEQMGVALAQSARLSTPAAAVQRGGDAAKTPTDPSRERANVTVLGKQNTTGVAGAAKAVKAKGKGKGAGPVDLGLKKAA